MRSIFSKRLSHFKKVISVIFDNHVYRLEQIKLSNDLSNKGQSHKKVCDFIIWDDFLKRGALMIWLTLS
jgi:hypothetical protein